jgi:hypothetical protein
MIIALAGRRIDEKGSDTKRFPIQNVQLVRNRLKNLFKNLIEERDAKGIISSAACGSDLIALDLAEELGLHRRIVLSSEPEKFRQTSVIDRPGNWGEVFDKIYQMLDESGNVIVMKSYEDNDQLYLETNKKILDEADSFANEVDCESMTDNSNNRVLTVIVWEGSSRGENDITADFANTSRARNLEVIEILTK